VGLLDFLSFCLDVHREFFGRLVERSGAVNKVLGCVVVGKRGALEPRSAVYGKAFENWVYHELTAYREYAGEGLDLSYWKLTSGAEVDFIVNQMDLAIEAKASAKITDDHLRSLRELAKDHPKVKQRIVVCLETKARITSDGIKILPVNMFIERLWGGMKF
jgi:predicted AAA+ superfamily ATPase